MDQQPQLKSELELFLEQDTDHAGERIVDTLDWLPEENTNAGVRQWGCDYKGRHITKNELNPVNGETKYQYGIHNAGIYGDDIRVLEFQLQQLKKGGQPVK